VTESNESSPQPPNPPPGHDVKLTQVRTTNSDACIADAAVVQAVHDAQQQYPAQTDASTTDAALPVLFVVRVHSW
jgi:hypothetical protein